MIWLRQSAPTGDEKEKLRLRLIQMVAADGEFSVKEQEELKENARQSQYSMLADTITRWQKLHEGNAIRGFLATELDEVEKSDPQLARVWARLGRDQLRYQRYFGRNFGQPLLFSETDASSILSQLDGKTIHGNDEELEEFQRLVYVLSSDLFEGRDAGARGGELAKHYLCDEIQDTLGWKTRTQSVSIPRDVTYKPEENCIQVGTTAVDRQDPNAPEPFIFSAPQTRITAKTISLPLPYKKSDLQNVAGKIVLFKPAQGDQTFDPYLAAQDVFNAHAVGVLVLTNEVSSQYFQWPQDLASKNYELNQYDYWLNEPTRQIRLMYRATRFADDRPLTLAGPVFQVSEYAPVYKMLDSIDPETQVTVESKIQWEIGTSENVIAEAQPENPRPVVLLTSHYDHLGKAQNPFQPINGPTTPTAEEVSAQMKERDAAIFEGKKVFERGIPRSSSLFQDQKGYAEMLAHYHFVHDAIFNGAADNASGCALNLLLARELDAKIPLTLTFFTGEEWGLLGSKALARNWQSEFGERPLSFVLNMDMPAVTDLTYPQTIQYRLAGQATQSQKDILEILLLGTNQVSNTGFNMSKVGYPNENLENRSDQAAFQDMRFPQARTLFLTGGFNQEYHSPTDSAEIVHYQQGQANIHLAAKFLTTLDSLHLLE